MNKIGVDLTLIAALGLTACGHAASEARLTPRVIPSVSKDDSTKPNATSNAKTPIQHVVIIVQENRSFDNLFATFPGADGATRGKNHLGRWVTLKKSKLGDPHSDPGHLHHEFEVEYDHGNMDGFDLISMAVAPGIFKPAGEKPYQYVDPAQIAPYWTLAKRYTLADRFFESQTSGSFTAHQYLIRGDTKIDGSKSLIDIPFGFPWGCDAPKGTVTSLITREGRYLFQAGPRPCMKYRTLRDLLDEQGLSWRMYTPPLHYPNVTGDGGQYDAFGAIAQVACTNFPPPPTGCERGPEWGVNVSMPETNIFGDIGLGKLPAVSWVIPDGNNSDHPLEPGDTGPSWVAQIVNAVGASRYWNSTAIVVVWDDWGGWYDHVKPPQLDAQGLCFRVPALIVSSYAKPAYISHTQYEFGSILKFVEDNWSLGRLHTTDVRANSIADAFDFKQSPRPFKVVPAKYSRDFFLHEAPSGRPLDDE